MEKKQPAGHQDQISPKVEIKADDTLVDNIRNIQPEPISEETPPPFKRPRMETLKCPETLIPRDLTESRFFTLQLWSLEAPVAKTKVAFSLPLSSPYMPFIEELYFQTFRGGHEGLMHHGSITITKVINLEF